MNDFYVFDENGLTLKVRDYIKENIVVRLLPVVHIAQEPFFKKIQLLATGKVLYEAIGGLNNGPVQSVEAYLAGSVSIDPYFISNNAITAAQILCARIFNLSYQFDVIDYESMDLFHTDLSMDDIDDITAKENFRAALEKTVAYMYMSLAYMNAEKLFEKGDSAPLERLYHQFLIDTEDDIIKYDKFNEINSFRDQKLILAIDNMLLHGHNTISVLYGVAHVPLIQSHLFQKGLTLEKERSLFALSSTLPR